MNSHLIGFKQIKQLCVSPSVAKERRGLRTLKTIAFNGELVAKKRIFRRFRWLLPRDLNTHEIRTIRPCLLEL